MPTAIRSKSTGTPLLAVLICLFAFAAGMGQDRAVDSDAPTIEEIAAGTRHNRQAFGSLHVIWQRATTNGAAMSKSFKRSLTDLQARLDDPDLTASKKAELQADIDRLQATLNNLNVGQGTAFITEFFTDGVGFQIRYPNTMGVGSKPPARFDFPTEPATPESLPGTFANMHVVHFDGNHERGFPIWTGMQRAQRTGVIYAKLGAFADIAFPPLALAEPAEWPNVNPLDAFLARLSMGFVVRGRTQLDGRDVILIEGEREIDPKALFDPDFAKTLNGRIRRFDFERAWIDAERGWLPLRVEYAPYWIADGKRVDDAFGINPQRVIEEVEIAQVEGGGYYPMHLVERTYNADASLPGPRRSLTEILLEGKAEPRGRILHEETEFTVEHVDTTTPTSQWKGFAFPPDTAYADELAQARAAKEVRSRFNVAIFFYVAAAIGVLFWWWRRRRV